MDQPTRDMWLNQDMPRGKDIQHGIGSMSLGYWVHVNGLRVLDMWTNESTPRGPIGDRHMAVGPPILLI